MTSTSFCCLALSTWQCLILLLHSNTWPAFADRYTPDVLSTDEEVHLQADELAMTVGTHSGDITSDAEQSMFMQADGETGSFYTAIVFNKEFVQQLVKQDVQLIVNMFLNEKKLEAKVLWDDTSMQLMPPTLKPRLKGLPENVMWCHLSVSLEFTPDSAMCLELKWYFGKEGFVFFHADISAECQASVPNQQPSWLSKTRLGQFVVKQFEKFETSFLQKLSEMASFPQQCVQVIADKVTTHFFVEVAEVLDSYPNLGFVISWRKAYGGEALDLGLKAKVLWNETNMQLMPPTLRPKLKGLPENVMWCHLNASVEFASDTKMCLELKWYFGKEGFVIFHADISEECQASIPNNRPGWLSETSFGRFVVKQFDKFEYSLLQKLSEMASFPQQCVKVVAYRDTAYFLVQVAEVLDSYPNLGFVISWRKADGEAVDLGLKAFPGKEVMQRMQKTRIPSVAALFSPEALILRGAPLKLTNLGFKILDFVSYGLTPGQKLLNLLIKQSGAAPNSQISHAEYVHFGDGTTYEKVKGMIVMPGANGLVSEVFTEAELNANLYTPPTLQQVQRALELDAVELVHTDDCIGFRDANED